MGVKSGRPKVTLYICQVRNLGFEVQMLIILMILPAVLQVALRMQMSSADGLRLFSLRQDMLWTLGELHHSP